MNLPTFQEETTLWNQGIKHIAGVDEVGRGPLAGPVVAAAVIITDESLFSPDEKEIVHTKIKDSKKLSAIQREKVFDILIQSKAIEYGLGTVSEQTIDEINILQASLLAMEYAVRAIPRMPDFLLIDGQIGRASCRERV